MDAPHDRAIDALTIALGQPRHPGADVDAVADAVPAVLEAAGWIDAAEAAAWRMRLLARPGLRERPETHPEAAAILAEVRGGDEDRWEATIDALTEVGAVGEEVAGAPPRARWQLLRVVPGPPQRVDGWRITVACVYNGGIGVRWHAEAAHDTAAAVVPQGAAADDRGTAYAACRARIESHLGEWLFTPAPPRDAAHLDVTLDGRDFRIPL